MSTIQALFWVVGLLLGAIGYFLKSIHNKHENHIKATDEYKHYTTEELGRLKGKIELVELESRAKYAQIQEVTQIELRNLATSVGKLTDNVDKLIQNKFN